MPFGEVRSRISKNDALVEEERLSSPVKEQGRRMSGDDNVVTRVMLIELLANPQEVVRSLLFESDARAHTRMCEEIAFPFLLNRMRKRQFPQEGEYARNRPMSRDKKTVRMPPAYAPSHF